MTKRKPKDQHKPNGRPSDYRVEYNDRAYHMALLGATDAQLADAFDVTVATISNWKLAHPKFLEALKRGKDEADANVAKSLYHRALGYEHPAIKIMTRSLGDGEGSVIEEVPYTERYPPDTTAAIFWLKNRQKLGWRDRHEVEHSGTVSVADALTAARQRALNREPDKDTDQ